MEKINETVADFPRINLAGYDPPDSNALLGVS